MANVIQFSILSFVVIALIISVVYGDKIQKSKRKHIIGAGFLLLASFIHASAITIECIYNLN